MVTGIEALKVQIFHRAGTPQTQRVDRLAAPAHHRCVVGNRPYGFARGPDLAGFARSIQHRGAGYVQYRLHAAAKADLVDHFRTFELPRVTEVQPVLGLLLLPAVDDCLTKQAMLITNAVTVTCDAQRRHAFHKACGQPTETTVAQRRIGFQRTNVFQIDLQVLECFSGDFQNAQIAQAVEHQAPDQEFERQVIHALFFLSIDVTRVVHPLFGHFVAGRQGDCHEPVMVERMVGILADGILEFGEHSFTKGCHFSVTNVGFRRHRVRPQVGGTSKWVV